ncbi:MAG: NUDIX domain-containing protein, partial [Pseudomonadota bacterium]
GGHIEPGETPEQAIVREVREETRWQFRPTGFVGAYLWFDPLRDARYMRLVYCGHPVSEDDSLGLDPVVSLVDWRSRDDLFADAARLRAEVVLHCIDDYLTGQRQRFTLARAEAPAALVARARPILREL